VSDDSGSGGFRVPSGRHRVEEVVRGSRFITTVAHAPGEEEARGFIDEIRSEFSDATHNCWAFVAGPPGTTARIGMSDDGEPHGTAGRPMLETLLHSGVGEVAAVVTRYFGGTKLGRGGLGRAYSGGVKAALDTLPTGRRVNRERVRIEVGYAAVDALFRALAELDGVRVEEDFGETARIVAAVPRDRIPDLERAVADMTGGTGRVER
jgi:uncharacterized YigZ family protein